MVLEYILENRNSVKYKEKDCIQFVVCSGVVWLGLIYKFCFVLPPIHSNFIKAVPKFVK